MAKNGPFQLCFLLMKLVGITKPGRDDRPTLVYSVQMATLFLMVYLWASLTITMKDPEADIITKLETGLYGVGLTHITCKLMFLRASSVDLVSLLEEMEVGWSEALERPRDRGLMARAERQSGMVPRGLTVMFTVTCLCAFGLATLTGNEPYPGILVPFDRITSPLMHSTIQSLAMFLLVCILLVFYTILASVTLQLSTHIQILCEDLKDIGSDEAGCPEAAEGFRGCVRLHHKIIRWRNKLNRIFGGLLFQEILLSSIQCCLSAYHCYQRNTKMNLSTAVLYAEVTITVLMPLIICSFGERIKNASSQISFSAYSSKWYCQNKTVKRSICILMGAAQQPLTLQYKNMFVCDFVQYSLVIQAAYSYFTVLQSLDFK